MPVRFSPRAPVRARAWACGAYAGAHRGIIIAAKERGSHRARELMGMVVLAALRRLVAQGEVMPPSITPIVLVPAPTRRASARQRGGDPITLACAFAARQEPGVVVVPVVRTESSTKDSSELGAQQRRANLSGRIVPIVGVGSKKLSEVRQLCSDATVVLVDDVATTGATAAETELVLASLGVRVDLVVVVARA
nr:ComF family protein [Corynebacterium lactis]